LAAGLEEAAEALRGLVDALVLVPVGDELRIELKGNLVGMLSAAQNAKRSPEGDLSLQIAMVAEARNRQYRLTFRYRLLVNRSARERFHNATVTRAFRHSGGHAGPFGRVTSYIGCLVTSVVWVPVNTRMVTLTGVKSGKDTGQGPVAEVQVVLLVDPSGAVTTTVTGV
jgi:hypothetical protein